MNQVYEMYCVTSLISLQPTSKRMNKMQIHGKNDGSTFLLASKNLRIIELKFLFYANNLCDLSSNIILYFLKERKRVKYTTSEIR